jgi:nicotinamide-nucleotide amidase
MNAEIISIGDELTSGQRLDTNSQWLAQQLGDLGIRTLVHTTVGDDLAANVAVFRAAIERADFVVATGGLGPTADDLTRQALADTLGVELVFDEAQLEHIRSLFERRRRTMPPQNRLQAMFPAGSRPIPNPEGTAPGIEMEIARANRVPCRVYALPGVPAEMKAMWFASVAPAIRTALPATRVICHRRIKCYGVGESHLEAMLPDLIVRGRTPLVGITVSGATITLRITAEGATDEECLKSMAPTIATIRSSLGEIVFGEEDDELEDVVVRMLRERRITVGSLEFGSAGLLAQWLIDAQQRAGPGRNVFARGIVVAKLPTVEEATRELSIDLVEVPDTNHPAYLTEAARTALGECDIRLVVGPLPPRSGPGEGPSHYHVVLVTDDEETCALLPLIPHSDLYRIKAAKDALDMLRRWLLAQK